MEDVGIGFSKGACGWFVREEEDGHIERVGEGAGEEEVAARMGFAGEAQVLGAVGFAALQVVGGEVVEEEPVHGLGESADEDGDSREEEKTRSGNPAEGADSGLGDDPFGIADVRGPADRGDQKDQTHEGERRRRDEQENPEAVVSGREGHGFRSRAYTSRMTLEEAVWRDPERMRGQLCFRGDRVLVSTLFDYMAAGQLEDFYHDFPDTPREQIEAVIREAWRLVDGHTRLPIAA